METRLLRQPRLLSDYTTFRIGGPAKEILEIKSADEMARALARCEARQEKWLVIGRGSNVLFDDRGFNGTVLINRIETFRQQGNDFIVGAGMSLPLLSTRVTKLGFGGLEFALGIPGSVGGAIAMNAGADGSETADFLVAVKSLTRGGEARSYLREELQFGYRSSPFLTNREVVVEATFRLALSSTARERQLRLITRRKKSQPLQEKSAGCIFRNPPGQHAGALIEQCGLKGLIIGGAQVSTTHANFIVNRGGALSADVQALIAKIKAEVKGTTGIDLHDEVRYIPSGYE